MTPRENGCFPSILSDVELDGDLWARQHPEEAQADEARAKAAMKEFLKVLKESDSGSIAISLFFQTITKRQRMNQNDLEWRKKMEEED